MDGMKHVVAPTPGFEGDGVARVASPAQAPTHRDLAKRLKGVGGFFKDEQIRNALRRKNSETSGRLRSKSK